MGLAMLGSCLSLHAANWLPFGPDGGDARSFAADPQDHSHLYLGTATGWIYESHDGGGQWKRLAWIGKRDDLALDSIIVDSTNSRHIVVGAWVLGSPDGGMYSSHDGGVSWTSEGDMHGQSIRALTMSVSDSKILIAGTLKGVYRSTDSGDHWRMISPEGSEELHEVESIAIDPVNPLIIYAGTWHLPWKTVDGGEHWTSIRQGVIDDSDVFSIIVDPRDSKVVYASACSGIYKSSDAGERFQKVQGIPSTARRTRVLMQDPQHSNIVFAGTTEGLWRTVDSGATWLRTTGPEVIVNDVFIDPSNANRMMLATDRGGVLASNDGGSSFVSSNSGFSARQITSYVADATRPTTIYVGVVNDKLMGGVFVSENGGLSWAQKSAGLNGHDVYSLGEASDGTILAGTGHGLYRLQGEVWSRVTSITIEEEAVLKPAAGSKATGVGKRSVPRSRAAEASIKAMKAREEAKLSDAAVGAITRSDNALYAATAEGVVSSATAGESWKRVAGLEHYGWNFVAASKSVVIAATLKVAMLSMDEGKSWAPVKLPEVLEQLSGVAVDSFGGLWVSGRQGVFYSQDQGATWQTLKNLSLQEVNSLSWDEPTQQMLITTRSKNTIAFGVHLPDKSVRYWETGWNMKLVRAVGDHLVGATLFDGMVVQPQMIDSTVAGGH